MRDRDIIDRRELILTTAVKLFSRRGYFNTSVHDIQKESNVSIGSIYHHFGNKEAIAEALFRHFESVMSEIVSGIVADYDTAHDRCYAVIAYLFQFTEEHPDAMHYMLYAKHKEFMPESIPICSSRPFTMMKKVVEEGAADGEIRPMEIGVAAAAIFGGALRLIHLRLDQVLENRLETYLDECWDCAWRGVAADYEKYCQNDLAISLEVL